MQSSRQALGVMQHLLHSIDSILTEQTNQITDFYVNHFFSWLNFNLPLSEKPQNYS